jgi:signal transduction histidine kinase
LNVGDGTTSTNESTNGDFPESFVSEALGEFASNDLRAFEGTSSLKSLGYVIAYPLVRKDRVLGIMLIDAPAETLSQDMRGILEVVSGQVALAIEDHRLIEENARLELRLAQDARLAALGQMAATVAHEVKNPLSAIKSIAQVLREDRKLHEYDRDLGLIVGETDRLNNSVTQLLSFARNAPEAISPASIDELIRDLLDLFKAQAVRGNITMEFSSETDVEVSGANASAIRDGLSNLLLNALQATPAGGQVKISATVKSNNLLISVADTGRGIVPELEERIWEPFFTTRQRGTGLGLAIVRKRIEEVGGTTRLAKVNAGEGTRFELLVPLT